MYMVYMVQALHILNILQFAFKCMLTSLVVTVIKTLFMDIVHIFLIDVTIDVIVIFRSTSCGYFY